ncbi:DUF742 domain-containing protein [Lipingzhangella sp. LS1_29]|uniref:DUF742 domain-containing protein n=1 Tax=Lipingzhangella rawalii TaxID=2055835 RepID=A0ABU2H2Q5_9ACTN|nr:DUF742 domain-containing protein [Lipingzhangella rawalii]MDS1269583.1 DUF742 domain-containing protein [Lipingzhangella rawalii]
MVPTDPGSPSWFGQQPPSPSSESHGGAQAGPRSTPPTTARPGPQPAADTASSSLVRPYAVTRGRTKPRAELPLEALISTTAAATSDPGGLTPECQSISDLCREWRSVAEISALLHIPLGVARVLVADMADQGLVQVRTSVEGDSRPNVNLLERVLSGLRKL